MPPKAKSYPELEKRKHLLGTLPDHEVAAQAGTSPAIVGRYRRSLGISPYDGYKFGRRGGDEAAAPAAASADAAPAPEKKTRRRRSKIDPFVHLFGTTPDAEIAKLAGVTTEAVRMYRRRRGVAPASRSTAAAPAAAPATAAAPAAVAAPAAAPKRQKGRRRSRLDPHYHLLGVRPDAEVAALAGVTPENVRAFRKRHSIPRHSRKAAPVAAVVAPAVAAPVAAAPAAAPVVAPVAKSLAAPKAAPAIAVGSVAWAIRLAGNDEVFVVTADDVASAARRAIGSLAAQSVGGTIARIERLGRALA